MKEFLDSLSLPQSRIRDAQRCAADDKDSLSEKINPLKEMATLHRILYDILPLMERNTKKGSAEEREEGEGDGGGGKNEDVSDKSEGGDGDDGNNTN